MKRKDVIIIAPSIVPQVSSWGEGQRMYYLANDLQNQGMDVLTISPKRRESREYKEKPVYYESVFLEGYSNIGDRKRDTKQAWAVKETHCDSSRQSRKQKILYQCKQIVHKILEPIDRFFFNEPSRYEGYRFQRWMQNNKSEILNIIGNSKTGKVLISGPSFSLFAIAKAIKQSYPDRKIILDYRDPWYLWNYKKTYAYFKEKKILTYADKVICFSKPFQRDMCKVFGLPEDKTDVVYNGYSEREWGRLEERQEPLQRKANKDKLILTYTGAISLANEAGNYRNPNPLIRAVQKVGRGRVELRFIGIRPEDMHQEGQGIRLVENVSQERAFQYMLESDVLINIHHTTDASGNYIVSGKFYDYMRSGKVIWNIGKESGLVRSFMKEYELGISCENEEEQVESTLLQIMDAWEKGELQKLRSTNKDAISCFSREYQNKKYIDMIRRL